MDVREEMKEERKKHDNWLKKWFNVIWPFSKNKEMRKEIDFAVAYCLADDKSRDVEKTKRKLIKKYGVKGTHEILEKVRNSAIYGKGVGEIAGVEIPDGWQFDYVKDGYMGKVIDWLLEDGRKAKEVIQKFRELEADDQTLPRDIENE